MKFMQGAFKDVHVNKFSFDIAIMDDHYHTTVSWCAMNANVYNLTIPKGSTGRLCFGTCTCGIPSVMGFLACMLVPVHPNCPLVNGACPLGNSHLKVSV